MILAVVFILACGYFAAARAQIDGSKVPETPHSVGQPARLRIAVSVQGGYAYDLDSSVGRIFANLTPEDVLGLGQDVTLDFDQLVILIGFTLEI